ncbi:hypothetical protein FA15DRAFT_671677 [Coprinopsis marcescibilis]|uniref:MARVEL domain-containing protein n=1 Tax=Coprinopsis marcescibilis TaxID=230819 RepID=A0A5C3KQA6_COPMA|nr:hypothetical protein FA15DRAFT_671677 [Coprinopsis marcescibilis]
MATTFAIICFAIIASSIATINEGLDAFDMWGSSDTRKIEESALGMKVFGLITSTLTIFTLPTMLGLSMLKSNAVTSRVLIEIVWIGFLAFMWLIASSFTAISGVCPPAIPGCHKQNALRIFHFTTWILLLCYVSTITLLSFFKLERRPPQITAGLWRSSVREFDWEFSFEPPEEEMADGSSMLTVNSHESSKKAKRGKRKLKSSEDPHINPFIIPMESFDFEDSRPLLQTRR